MPATVLPAKLSKLKVSLAHDWLTGMRGGEKVLQALLEIFPRAPLYTLVHVPHSVSLFINDRVIHTSFIQHLPGAKRLYRHYLPFFPLAIKNMQVHDCDLLLSTSHCAIKALKARGRHISYIHSPMRYVWDQYQQYYNQAGIITRLGMAAARPFLQHWDKTTVGNVNGFMANSQNVAERVRRTYKREAHVVYPPVELLRFTPRPGPKNYYLVVSALVPYKRVDLAVAACTKLNLPLKVVGTGPQAKTLQAMAGASVEFLGWRDNHQLAELYAGAKAFLFPGEEDFGITPLEAAACGCPVLAFGKGGATETVLGQHSPTPTGRFFYEQSVDALCDGIARLEKDLPHFDLQHLTNQAAKFSPENFRHAVIEALLAMV